ncbi:hypothetical protein FRC09_005112, partial [Ceratobasidium sp. 395]
MLGLLSSHFRKQNAPENQDRILQRGAAPPVEYEQQVERAGLLCTKELEIAIAGCKKKVEAIARDCRARNARYRDIEFDLEEDRERCLYGLATPDEDRANPSDALRANQDGARAKCPLDVLRVTQIFDKPQFFIDGASCSDVAQGALGNCWFMSAISVVSTMEGLVERICPARDEQVGVYGFIFYRDSGWVDVIIDDLLYTKIPKFEELRNTENDIYHDDKDLYERHARKGSKTLYFGRSKTENETWVPLLEKAYAKLHGDYDSLRGGYKSEAIEDMTGGLSTIFHIHDILDTDKFWNEQLLRANKDRLFGCYIYSMAGATEVKGLYTMHAYSILDALEVAGKRFLRLRNPWGKSEWKGRWSDGSKEWSSEWLARLPELKHQFDDDGEFLMEYCDFLKTWTMVELSRLFDSDWKLSSMWMNVTSRSFPCAWSFGDVSFTISVSEDTPAVIVLSRLDDRYFSELSGCSSWSMDFVVYRKGAPAEEPYTRSTHTVFWRRSVNVELDHLEAGDYVVHVRLDCDKRREKTFYKDNISKWNPRKLSKVWAEACLSKSIAVNFNPHTFGNLLPASIENFGGEDLTSLELSHYEKSQTKQSHPSEAVATPLAMESTTNGESSEGKDTETEQSEAKESELGNEVACCELGSTVVTKSKDDKKDEDDDFKNTLPKGPDELTHYGYRCDECSITPIVGLRYYCLDASCSNYNICSQCMSVGKHNPAHRLLCIRNLDDANKVMNDIIEVEDSSLTLGLK